MFEGNSNETRSLQLVCRNLNYKKYFLKSYVPFDIYTITINIIKIPLLLLWLQQVFLQMLTAMTVICLFLYLICSPV